jgi:hypothetical protein
LPEPAVVFILARLNIRKGQYRGHTYAIAAETR